MRLTAILAVAAGLFGTSNAHMAMDSPAPINHKANQFSNNIDYSYTTPQNASPFPCKGQLSNLAGKAGTPVATWATGSSQTIRISGGAPHNGGSCQFSLSYDQGKTFRVIKSIIGKCPLSPSYSVTIPRDAPSGQSVLFAWTWFNRTGNREMYMNCAVVTISGGAGRASLKQQGGSCGKRYTVVSGDFCWKIATDNGLTLDGLLAANPGLNCNNLSVGSSVCLAGGSAPANNPPANNPPANNPPPVSGGGGGASWNSRPLIFVANIAAAGGVTTPEGTDFNFPQPGPDVERN